MRFAAHRRRTEAVFAKEKGVLAGICSQYQRHASATGGEHGFRSVFWRFLIRVGSALEEISNLPIPPGTGRETNLAAVSGLTACPMTYFCEATSIAGFLQQLAVSYLRNGYYFYVTGIIPEHKDPQRTDEKIVRQYGLDISKWTRARRKALGQANVQYLRFERFFVIMATGGTHMFFEAEKGRILDARETPIRLGGYSVSYRRARDGTTWHPSVRLDKPRYLELKSYFESLAVHGTAETILSELAALKLETYAPVRGQLCRILNRINQARGAAGLGRVSYSILSTPRRSIKALKSER